MVEPRAYCIDDVFFLQKGWKAHSRCWILVCKLHIPPALLFTRYSGVRRERGDPSSPASATSPFGILLHKYLPPSLCNGTFLKEQKLYHKYIWRHITTNLGVSTKDMNAVMAFYLRQPIIPMVMVVLKMKMMAMTMFVHQCLPMIIPCAC